MENPATGSWYEIDCFSWDVNPEVAWSWRLGPSIRRMKSIIKTRKWLSAVSGAANQPKRLPCGRLGHTEITEQSDRVLCGNSNYCEQLLKTFHMRWMEVCRKLYNSALAPWIDLQIEEIEDFQERITNLTKRLKRCNDSAAREARRWVRKSIKVTWEEEWWLEIIDEAKPAERFGDIKKLYSTLRTKQWNDGIWFLQPRWVQETVWGK